MEDVHDLEGVGEVFLGEVPDPGGAVAEDDLLRGVEEASALDLAEDPFGEGGKFGFGVEDGDGLDGGVVGDGVRVAGGIAVLVARVCGPDDGELGFAGLGGAVGLFALTAPGLGLADGDAGAVESEIEGVGVGGLGFDDLVLVLRDGAPEGFGLSFHQLGLDVETGQFGQKLAGFGEADASRGDPGHAERGGGEGGVVQPQSPIPGSEAVTAVVAVIPGAAQGHRTEGGGEGPGSVACVAGLGAAATGQRGAVMVGGVAVEESGDRQTHQVQGALAGGGLDRLEVEAVENAVADQAFGFGGDLGGDLRLEAPFFGASAAGARWSARSRRWQMRSLTSMSSRVSS